MSDSFGPIGKVLAAAGRHGLLVSASGVTSQLGAVDIHVLAARPLMGGKDAPRFLFGAAPRPIDVRAPLPTHDHRSIHASAQREGPTPTSGCTLEPRHATASRRAKISESLASRSAGQSSMSNHDATVTICSASLRSMTASWRHKINGAYVSSIGITRACTMEWSDSVE